MGVWADSAGGLGSLLSNRRERMRILAGLAVVYAASFPFAYPVVDHYYFVAGLLPIVVAGSVLGFRAAVATVLFVSLVHFVALAVALGRPLDHAAVESAPIVTLLIGGAIGYLRDLRVALREQREELADTNRRIRRDQALKDTVREVLFEVSDRRAVERSFCTQIADGGYPFTCICGESAAGGLSIRSRAGDLAETAERPEFALADRAPPATALERGETVWVDDATNSDAGWAKAAVEAGIRSAVAVPLQHNNLAHGVLCVYDEARGAFDADGRQLLEDLADTIAYAIHDTYRRDALRSDHPIDVTVSIDGGESYLFDLAGDDRLPADYRVSVFESSAGTEAGVTHHLRLERVDTEVVAEIVRNSSGVRSVDAGGSTKNVITVGLDTPTLGDTFVDLGAAVRSVTVGPECLTVTARFSRNVDLGAVVDELESAFEGVSLRSKASDVEAAVSAAGVVDRLTEKQLEALRVAAMHGFFDRPQGKTAEELAAMLGVSRPTFLTHVRAAEAELVEAVVGDHATVHSIEARADD